MIAVRYIYAYAANDPLNLVDPYGLAPDGPQAAAAGGMGGGGGAQAPPVVAAAGGAGGGDDGDGSNDTAVTKYEVGTFDALKARSVIGDNLDIHHVVQSNPASQIINNYNRFTAPAIALPQAEHQLIPTLSGTYNGTTRDLLARDIWNLRNYTNAPNRALQQLIELNKTIYLGAFER